MGSSIVERSQIVEVRSQKMHRQNESNTLRGPIRAGKKPSKFFNIQAFAKEVNMIKFEFGGQDEVTQNQNEIVDKRIIAATDQDVKYLYCSGPNDVKNVHSYPMSAIGMVKNSLGHGTGCLIGPNIVLTCAHNCFNPIEKYWQYQDIRFIPAQIQQTTPFKGFKTREIYIPKKFQQFKEQGDINQEIGLLYDYAILILENQLPNSKIFTGKINLQDYFGSIGYDFDWEIKEQQKSKVIERIDIFGYPITFKPSRLKQYHGASFCDKYCLLYTITTAEGVSGAPILWRDSQYGYWVKAIHQRDASAIIHNTRAALKLSRPMLENIQNNMRTSVLLYQQDLSNPQIASNSQKITASNIGQNLFISLSNFEDIDIFPMKPNESATAKKYKDPSLWVEQDVDMLRLRQQLCPIDLQLRPLIRLSNCGHYFHLKCILQWRKKRVTCPICLSEISDHAFLHCQGCLFRSRLIDLRNELKTQLKSSRCEDCAYDQLQ